ncbi:hypothetical protein PAPYR_2016 [Paratrimastix pyriformis]|uniref:CBM20 domain-containing protein n=1 Tax=Paratrimastix pyriformis TaxID=342808 RepID=A0ABQ8UUM2_9EUKA|nr:hypothetical protein PAPYR_2016 [Paratrimastix pyriformis]
MIWVLIEYHSNPSQQLVVSGSTAELGNWKVEDAVPLYPLGNTGTWLGKLPIFMPHVEFKFVVVGQGEPVWEDGPNRTILNMPSGTQSTILVKMSWQKKGSPATILDIALPYVIPCPAGGVRVAFMTYAPTRDEDAIAVLGEIPALSRWDVHRPLVMYPLHHLYPPGTRSPGFWWACVPLPADQLPTTFKYVGLSNFKHTGPHGADLRWEEGPNRTLTHQLLPSPGTSQASAITREQYLPVARAIGSGPLRCDCVIMCDEPMRVTLGPSGLGHADGCCAGSSIAITYVPHLRAAVLRRQQTPYFVVREGTVTCVHPDPGPSPDPAAPTSPEAAQLVEAVRSLSQGHGPSPVVGCQGLLQFLAQHAGGCGQADAFEVLQQAMSLCRPPLGAALVPAPSPADAEALLAGVILDQSPRGGEEGWLMPSVASVATSAAEGTLLPEWLAFPLLADGRVGFRLWAVVLHTGSPSEGHFFVRCAMGPTRCRRCAGCLPPDPGAPPTHPLGGDPTEAAAPTTLGGPAPGPEAAAERVWYQFDFEDVRLVASQREALTVPQGARAYLLLYGWCECL